MKIKYLFVLSFVVGCLGFTAIESIRWEWPKEDSTKIEFGLRSDGVVVWREIINTTNSPSEKQQKYWWESLTNYYISTNIFLTNIISTNIILNNN